jgi:hypothetical protein
VEPFDFSDIKDQCYGGGESQYTYDQINRKNVASYMQKPYSAYMLFYKQLDAPPSPSPSPAESKANADVKSDVNGSPTPAANTLASTALALAGCGPELLPSRLEVVEAGRLVPTSIFGECWAANSLHTKEMLVFDHANLHFCYKVINGPFRALQGQDTPGVAERLPLLKLAALFSMHTLAHAKAKSDFPRWDTELLVMLKGNTVGCEWLCSLLAAQRDWLAELVLVCTNLKTRKAMAKLLLTAITQSRLFIDEPIEGGAEGGSDGGDLGSEEGSTISSLTGLAPQKKKRRITIDEGEPPEEDGEGDPSSATSTGSSPKGPSPATHVHTGGRVLRKGPAAQLLDTLLDVANMAMQCYKNCEQYWELLKQAADISPEHAHYLLKNQLVFKVAQFLLGEECPGVTPDFNTTFAAKHRRKHHLKLESIGSLLNVCVQTFGQDDEHGGPGISGHELMIFQEDGLFTALLEDEIDVQATADLISFLAATFDEIAASSGAMLLKGVDEAAIDSMTPYYVALGPWLEAVDPKMVGKCLARLLEITQTNKTHHECILMTLKYLLHWVQNIPVVVEWLSSERQWIGQYIFDDRRDVRLACRKVLMVVYTQTASAKQGAQDQLTLGHTHLFEALALLLKRATAIGGRKPMNLNQPKYLLREYLESLRIMVQPVPGKLWWMEYLPELMDLLARIGDGKLDLHKLGLIGVLEEMSRDCRPVVDELLQYVEALAGADVQLDWKIPEYIKYTEETLSKLYQIIDRCCLVQPALLSTVTENRTFKWSFENVFRKSHHYPRAAEEMLTILIRAVHDRPDYGIELIVEALSATPEIMDENARNHMALFNALLFIDPRIFETFIRHNGLDYISRVFKFRKQKWEILHPALSIISMMLQATAKELWVPHWKKDAMEGAMASMATWAMYGPSQSLVSTVQGPLEVQVLNDVKELGEASHDLLYQLWNSAGNGQVLDHVVVAFTQGHRVLVPPERRELFLKHIFRLIEDAPKIEGAGRILPYLRVVALFDVGARGAAAPNAEAYATILLAGDILEKAVQYECNMMLSVECMASLLQQDPPTYCWLLRFPAFLRIVHFLITDKSVEVANLSRNAEELLVMIEGHVSAIEERAKAGTESAMAPRSLLWALQMLNAIVLPVEDVVAVESVDVEGSGEAVGGDVEMGSSSSSSRIRNGGVATDRDGSLRPTRLYLAEDTKEDAALLLARILAMLPGLTPATADGEGACTAADLAQLRTEIEALLVSS